MNSFTLVRFGKYLIHVLLYLVTIKVSSQQVPDTIFEIKIDPPTFTTGINSPTIGIDESHNNFHTKDGNFAPFTKLAKKDGYEVVKVNSLDNIDKLDI